MYPHANGLKELAGYLKLLGSVHYRFMAERIDDEFRVTRLIVGPQATWKSYEYSEVIFIAGATYGEKVADWLLSGALPFPESTPQSLRLPLV